MFNRMSGMILTTPFAFRAPPCEDPSYCGGPQRHEAAYHSYMNIMRQARIAGPEELQAIIMGVTLRDPQLQRQLAMDTNIFIHLGMMPSDPFIIHGGSGDGEARHGPMGGAGLHAQMGASGPHALIGGRPGPSMMGGGFHDSSHPQDVGHHFGVQGGGFHGDPRLRGHAPFSFPHPQALGHNIAGHGVPMPQHEDPRLRGHAPFSFPHPQALGHNLAGHGGTLHQDEDPRLRDHAPFNFPHPQALGHDSAGHGGTLHQHDDPRLRSHVRPGQPQRGFIIPPPVGQNGYNYGSR